MKKKIISLILSAAMVATATVVPVSAADVKDFADVAADSWYYDSVDFVAERDYMNGTSATTFSPNDNMTRAMFVTVMARVAGVPRRTTTPSQSLPMFRAVSGTPAPFSGALKKASYRDTATELSAPTIRSHVRIRPYWHSVS